MKITSTVVRENDGEEVYPRLVYLSHNLFVVFYNQYHIYSL
jgi:hypothetical protein